MITDIGTMILIVGKYMVLQSNRFVEEIEHLCIESNVEYIDAVCMWCERNSLEVELVANWIKKEPTLKAKIQAEAEILNTIKRGAKLPI